MKFAPLAELVDAPDLGSGIERCRSSSLLRGTILKHTTEVGSVRQGDPIAHVVGVF